MLWQDLRSSYRSTAEGKSLKGDDLMTRYRFSWAEFKNHNVNSPLFKSYRVTGATVLTDDEKITVRFWFKHHIMYHSIIQIRLLDGCAEIEYRVDNGEKGRAKIGVRDQGTFEHELRALGKPVYYH